jgi:hypothetical protein
MGPRVGLDAVEKRKICCRCKKSNPGRSAGSLVAIPTELSRLHATKPVAMVTGLRSESRSDNRSTGCETWSFTQSDNTDSVRGTREGLWKEIPRMRTSSALAVRSGLRNMSP